MKSNFERVEEKQLNLGHHCKHMSPSPAQRSRATRTPPEAPRPGGSPAAQPSWVPSARDAAWRLFLSRLPHLHTARPPKTTLSVPIQWNVTAPNSSEPPRPSPRQSRVSAIAELRQGPKLHHVRPGTRAVTETHDSRPDPRPGPVPGANPALGAPTHPETSPQASSAASPAEARTRRRKEGSPPGPDPSAVQHRGEGPKCIPGLSRPTRTPPPTLPTWP